MIFGVIPENMNKQSKSSKKRKPQDIQKLEGHIENQMNDFILDQFE